MAGALREPRQGQDYAGEERGPNQVTPPPEAVAGDPPDGTANGHGHAKGPPGEAVPQGGSGFVLDAELLEEEGEEGPG